MRKRFPTALELVYDNYQFLAIGYCASERASDCVASLAVSPKGVALSFYYGATLPDPAGVLLGAGKQNRFVRLAKCRHPRRAGRRCAPHRRRKAGADAATRFRAVPHDHQIGVGHAAAATQGEGLVWRARPDGETSWSQRQARPAAGPFAARAGCAGGTETSDPGARRSSQRIAQRKRVGRDRALDRSRHRFVAGLKACATDASSTISWRMPRVNAFALKARRGGQTRAARARGSSPPRSWIATC